MCNQSYVDGEDWICCDTCSSWYHRNCVNLEDEEDWSSLTEEGAVFNCPFCQ